jgi:regulator of sigma E protease
VPLGGYVKFHGDADAASQPLSAEKLAALGPQADPDIFHAKPVWQRALIVAAGPFANFVLAILLFAGIYATVGKAVIEPRVDQVIEGSAAQAAGIREGDVLLRVDGRAVATFTDVQRLVEVRRLGRS